MNVFILFKTQLLKAKFPKNYRRNRIENENIRDFFLLPRNNSIQIKLRVMYISGNKQMLIQ